MVINIVTKELAVTTTVFIPLQSGVYAVLLRAPTCWFVRTRIEISFGELFCNFDGFAPWCLGVCVRAGRAWGSAPSISLGAAARTTCINGAPLCLVDSVCVETNEEALLLMNLV